jgi:hypothetical protein
MAWRLLFRCRDAEEAETLAMLEGLKFVGRWPEDTPVEMDSDCGNLVAKVKERRVERSVNSALISDIKIVVGSIQKVGRYQNQAAHNLTQHAIQT